MLLMFAVAIALFAVSEQPKLDSFYPSFGRESSWKRLYCEEATVVLLAVDDAGDLFGLLAFFDALDTRSLAWFPDI